MIISETVLAANATPAQRTCLHVACTPRFDPEACRWQSQEWIRTNWPRFNSVCGDCQQQVIIYASREHMEALGY